MIEVRLHVRKINVVILIPDTASRSPSLSVGFSIQDEATDFAQSQPQGVHYQADVIYLHP